MEDQFENIEAYLDGSLAGEARTRFESAMQQDEQLRSAVENYGDAVKISEGLLELDVAEVIDQLRQQDATPDRDTDVLPDNEVPNTTNMDRQSSRSDRSSLGPSRTLKIVSAFLLLSLLVGGSTWYLQKQESLERERVVASYIRPIDANASKSIDTVGMSLFEKGKYYFALNRFEDSEYWLERAVEGPTGEGGLAEIYFWLGAAHIEQWEVEEARRAWERSGTDKAKHNIMITQ